ncbi:MAG: hypothetical protein WBA12_05210, partial [Catalinimonas sp.]
MKWHYLERGEIDATAWDRRVDATAGVPYVRVGYLDAVSPGWCGLVADDYRAVMPVPVRRCGPVRRSLPPLYAQQLGVCADGPLAPELWGRLFALLRRRVPFADDYPFNTDNLTLRAPASVRVRPGLTQRLDLAPPYEALRRAYARDQRANLNRAARGGLRAYAGEDIEPLWQMFATHVAGRLYAPPAAAGETLARLWSHLKGNGSGEVRYVAAPDGELLAGALFVRHRQQII